MTSSWRVAWGTSAPRHPSPHPRILTALPVASGTRQELPMERHLPSRPAVTKKCLRFDPDATVWVAKQRILCSLNQSLKDVLNYGLFQPASNGRDGKFLDEERLLREYPQPAGKGIPSLEFRYKKRVYKQSSLDEKQLAKLHTKTNLKKFTDHIQHRSVEKITKMLERGLDPNFHDPDTGGRSRVGGDVSAPRWSAG
uniref:SH3 and multiple ankyrin repeat domains protein 2-like isoform X2 n=1 Tax=Panthera onca TaxID=9690 RepID=UPI0029532B03|nr:SH3 and multiple ankyrin repeat domains protein 2-like isoform X2 [Panthera onca]